MLPDGLDVFDLATGEPITSIPLPIVSDMHWIDEDTVVVGTNNGIWAKVSLRTEDLIASAAAGATRGFTAAECTTFRIDPCPSLEDLRRR